MDGMKARYIFGGLLPSLSSPAYRKLGPTTTLYIFVALVIWKDEADDFDAILLTGNYLFNIERMN